MNNESQETQNSEPIVLHDANGKFIKGHPKVGGIQKGTEHTFTTFRKEIVERIEADPALLEELVNYYLKNPRMRELLWKMIDGMPQGSGNNLNLLNQAGGQIVIGWEKEDS